ncbi:helix-turn-helix transcriptional regulator [Sediminibacillus halophilus]|uniref:DNA-binding transcriptional regulator, XRE-family HTH domain n=1 Tax=Sediminibacillus halophilus TaxID=482461 RepID=A0A1G9LTI1_9BACI|nr:helix-turn-helix domain-containing protein [Sediminibacillus halophilus]SDL65296.1 DNA-binding transcriptional regulator, XRE-family HTH domain [Sediminibacillus halophilus]
MDKTILSNQISSKIKLIRVERNYTQDKMAAILGISKKTLVQIEKGRTVANWTTTTAICALFRNSEVIRNMLGGDVLEVIETIAHTSIEEPLEIHTEDKVWWNNLSERNGYTLQQNVQSQHYRIVNPDKQRWYSSTDKEAAFAKFGQVNGLVAPK